MTFLTAMDFDVDIVIRTKSDRKEAQMRDGNGGVSNTRVSFANPGHQAMIQYDYSSSEDQPLCLAT